MFARKKLAKKWTPTFRMLVTELSSGTSMVTMSDVTARVQFYADMTPALLVVPSSEPVQTGMMVADSSMNVEPLMLQMTYPPLCGATTRPDRRGRRVRVPRRDGRARGLVALANADLPWSNANSTVYSTLPSYCMGAVGGNRLPDTNSVRISTPRLHGLYMCVAEIR